MSTALFWFRNDLRLHDNEGLTKAVAEHDQVLCVYPLDTRLFRKLAGPDFIKTGAHRAAFLLQCLADLRSRLENLGSDLAVKVTGNPAQAISEWIDQTGAATVYVQAEIMSEETDDEAEVERALPDGCTLQKIWGKSLYHREDLPFASQDCPEPFRTFRKAVERLPVRDLDKTPTAIVSPDYHYEPLPTLPDLGFREEMAAPAFPGGETAGLARLDYYLEETHLLQKYRYTRNSSLGADYSTKFSAYLAAGCLSPRLIYQRIIGYGEVHKNRGGSSVLFEMRWRDYFLFLGLKYGDRLFRAGGYKEKQTEWSQNAELFDNWREGKTGLPFIDAHMRELAATGFMSNRGRVNCASFLTRDYKIDWRWGAAWFEHCLIDYEVCANWFNWHTQALEIYYTSAPWQGLKYDKKGEYVKKWLPELAELPAPLVHAPWKMAEEEMLEELNFDLERDYHRPKVSNSKWDWAWNRLKTGDASSPKRKKK